MKLKIVDKRRFAMSSAVLITIIVAVLLLSGGKADKQQAYVEDTVIVHKGDTLWGIAELYCPSDMDKREYVRAIEADNDCTANIRVGDVITVRVYE